MKLSWALLLTSFQASHCNVVCLNKTMDSCDLCPRFYDIGENGGIGLDFDLCAGDCQIEGTGISQNCVPKAVNCGQKRESECSRCPWEWRERDGWIRNMNLCQGDCEVRTMRNSRYCFLKDEITTTTTQAPETPIESYPNYPTNTDADVQSTTVPNFLVPYEPDALLTVVKMEIRNTGRWASRITFYAEICVGSRCCETGEMSKRAGIFTFSEDFQNLGTCSQLRRHPNEAVRVTAKKGGREARQSPLQVMSITAQFDDESLVKAEDVRGGWLETTRNPLSWDVSRDMIEQEVEESINLPEPQCPENLTPAPNSCPKINVRVHERLGYSLKFCFYQECRTFTADLSTVQNWQLGSGGYCMPHRQMYPQYKYCCDLEQYFTLPDGNETPRQEINFPRCHSMNDTRNDI